MSVSLLLKRRSFPKVWFFTLFGCEFGPYVEDASWRNTQTSGSYSLGNSEQKYYMFVRQTVGIYVHMGTVNLRRFNPNINNKLDATITVY